MDRRRGRAHEDPSVLPTRTTAARRSTGPPRASWRLPKAASTTEREGHRVCCAACSQPPVSQTTVRTRTRHHVDDEARDDIHEHEITIDDAVLELVRESR